MESNCVVLLVEDDRIDQKSITRAFKDLKITNPLVTTQNGKEALEYLRKAQKTLPSLILLDLNMPRTNGIDFLHEVKKDENLRMIPVVVLTTSNEEKDIVESYKLSVAGYMIKPVDYKSFVEVIRTIDIYWKLSCVPPSHWS